MEHQEKVKPEAEGISGAKNKQVQRGVSKWTIIQWILIPLLLIVALGGGMAAGYVVLGKEN